MAAFVSGGSINGSSGSYDVSDEGFGLLRNETVGRFRFKEPRSTRYDDVDGGRLLGSGRTKVVLGMRTRSAVVVYGP